MIRARQRIARRIKEVRALTNISRDKKVEAIYSLISLGKNYPKIK